MPDRRVIAAFDFDDTLITRNTLTDFLFQFDPSAAIKLMWSMPLLVGTAARLVSRQRAKERLLKRFIGGIDEEEWDERCKAYADRLDKLASKEALNRVKWHQTQGHEVIIISASAEDWIRPWAARFDIQTVLATRLERKDGQLTGRLIGKNCRGPEKVARLLERYPERQSYELYAYGDGASDKELFSIADRVYKRRFT